MHVSDPSHSKPLTETTCMLSWHKKMSGPTSVTECEETDKDEEIVPKNGHTTLVNSESISLHYHTSVSLPASSQQTSPTASTSQTDCVKVCLRDSLCFL